MGTEKSARRLRTIGPRRLRVLESGMLVDGRLLLMALGRIRQDKQLIGKGGIKSGSSSSDRIEEQEAISDGIKNWGGLKGRVEE